jgi:hypothetical protein
MHAFEVSFDRGFDQQEFYNMVTELGDLDPAARHLTRPRHLRSLCR